ncbi:MAG TPA: SusD/RagB family nutrient-binding outer membrane lipoprotein, partial [Gemmatimonadales bacterium]|nr:SusD/RagB family nutrient-binding outer membrane lipoprotein [Gemmatimonadales bacterium]
MNTYRKAVTVLALTVIGAGCSEFLSGPGLTENPNNPTVATPLQKLVAVQANMATRLEGQLARCAGIFTQQLIGSNNQQLTWCTGYAMSESDISGAMSGFYTGAGLKGLRDIQAAAQASSDNFLLGIAKIWEGYAMGTAASVWGDLPYREAVTDGILSPALDPQQQVYADVQTRLDEGITALSGLLLPTPPVGNCVPSEGDLIYCATAASRATEIGRWIRAAHTLKARFYLHLVERQ